MSAVWETLPEVMQKPRFRPLFVMQLQVSPALMAGHAPAGERRIAVVQGGAFASDILQLNGHVHTGGSDWLTGRADGSLHLDARIVLENRDGGHVLMSYRGVRHASPDLMTRLAAGEEISPADYYFRIAPWFETADKSLDWLNRVAAMGIGHRLTDGVRYSIFEIL